MLDDKGRYLNFSGCGNTFSSDHPVVRNYLLECLRNWVVEGGVDGFRFDLASVLGRDRRGNVLVEPPVVSRISEDSLLRDVKLIAEPWDAAGLYQVGTFPGEGRWSDWNGRYRDDVRKFWRGDPDMTTALATRLCGSDDLYHGPRARSTRSTSSAATTDSPSTTWSRTTTNTTRPMARETATAATPTGAGTAAPRARPTDPERACAIRSRQVRNLLATLMVSQGVPMILGGDEFLRTQHGNNNAWCQDNPMSWVDWSLQRPERRFPAVRQDDDRLPQGPSGPAAPHVFHRRAAAGCLRKSSGMASSPPSPTSRPTASLSPSHSTAGGRTGPTWSIATSTWP